MTHIIKDQLASYQLASSKELSIDSCARIAAWIDCEGSIGIWGARTYPMLTICNTDRNALDILHYIIGCGNIVCHKRNNNNHKDLYYIRIGGRNDIYYLLKQLLPYFLVKRRQAELMLQFLSSSESSRLEIKQELSKLNKKGKRDA